MTKSKTQEATRAKMLGPWLTAALKLSKGFEEVRQQLLDWCGAGEAAVATASPRASAASVATQAASGVIADDEDEDI